MPMDQYLKQRPTDRRTTGPAGPHHFAMQPTFDRCTPKQGVHSTVLDICICGANVNRVCCLEMNHSDCHSHFCLESMHS